MILTTATDVILATSAEQRSKIDAKAMIIPNISNIEIEGT